jgi:hypothetical protein
MKTITNEKIATAAPLTSNAHLVKAAEKIPAIFKPFVGKTPAQFLEKYIAREKLEALAGAMFGFTDIGVAIPEWAKKSSIQFWKNYVGNKPLDPFKSAEDFGVFVKMLELYMQGDFVEPVKTPSKLEKFLSGIAGRVYSIVMKKIVSDFSDEENLQFYTGCVRAKQIIEKMKNPNYLDMIRRAKAYLIIATAWRQIEGFKTNAEREKWLDKADAGFLSSSEYYQIFKLIDLPGAAPGRPKKLETRAAEIAES